MLQKRYLLHLGVVTMILLGSCKKETTKHVSTTLKVPTIELLGQTFVSLPVGAAYTDQGATYTGEDGGATTIQPSVNEVNTAAPGLYFVHYEETSTSGIFHTEGVRVVAVTYQNNPIDYSGTYLRAATGVNVFVTKVAPGLYKVQNPGGAPGHEAIVVYFIESAANTFLGPLQENHDIGDVEITNITFSDTGGSWKMVNPFYGTALRVFTKV